MDSHIIILMLIINHSGLRDRVGGVQRLIGDVPGDVKISYLVEVQVSIGRYMHGCIGDGSIRLIPRGLIVSSSVLSDTHVLRRLLYSLEGFIVIQLLRLHRGQWRSVGRLFCDSV